MRRLENKITTKVHRENNSLWVEVMVEDVPVVSSPAYVYDHNTDTWNCAMIPGTTLTTQQVSNILTGFVARTVSLYNLVNVNVDYIRDYCS